MDVFSFDLPSGTKLMLEYVIAIPTSIHHEPLWSECFTIIILHWACLWSDFEMEKDVHPVSGTSSAYQPHTTQFCYFLIFFFSPVCTAGLDKLIVGLL